jgi:hypothetical protein
MPNHLSTLTREQLLEVAEKLHLACRYALPIVANCELGEWIAQHELDAAMKHLEQAIAAARGQG